MARAELVRAKRATTRFSIRELGPRTWRDFAQIVGKHNGVWGGCWCVTFHRRPGERYGTPAHNAALKERLVLAGRSHAALVYDGTQIVGWCQFGPPAELPGRMTGYGKLGLDLPDWRIPCFFVDRDRRRDGVAKAALRGALRIIAAKGGGTVDGYPISVRGKSYSSSFLWGGTESMFAEVGFSLVGRLGTSKVVMRKVVRSR
ncbi:MAG TPA: GNAT family N-acetyltransferase [bacterium]|nr:GNAT family N-acetyltransferase [bacterium]